MGRRTIIETPRGTIIQTSNGKAKLEWKKGFGPEYTKRFDSVQKFIDSEVLRLSSPMVPFKSGALKQSGLLGTVIGDGEVAYNAPYARYHYYGKLMVGRAPKRLTGRIMRYSGAPTRGPLWFERMKSQHRGRILAGAARIAGR